MTLSSRDAIMRLPTGSTKPTNTSIYALRSAFCTTNKMGPTTGLEPINRVFSPLPMIASSCVFIAIQYTRIGNVCKHFMCIFGKRREENHVQIVCKQGGCANFVQTKLTPESVQTCAKNLARRGAWLACDASRPSSGGQRSVRGLKPACGQRRRLTQHPQQTLRMNRMHR